MNIKLNRIAATCCALLCLLATARAADYSAWSHSGSMFIITTPEGANLPAGASETNFPLLVRLNSGNFNFAQAKADGSDIRFAIQGGGTATNPATALSYEIEQWDTANGVAAIWVKIPTITGNARQEIRMYWGNAAATSASNGAAVFSNNFATVFHMSQASLVQDAIGAITTKISDSGSTQSNGIIGKARNFKPAKNITCSDVTVLPVGNNPQTTQFWVRAEAGNSNVLGWGEQNGQAKVDISIVSPPRINIDNYFGPLSISSATTVALSQWIQVVCSWDGVTGKLYVNGVLDGTNSGDTLKMPTSANLYIGRHHTDENFLGDVDEVRISKVARSANWIKMEYANQKALQTLVGPLVPSGSTFSVTPATLTMNEGATTTLTGQAGGAQKLYWSRIDNGIETLLAVDQLKHTFTAERVTANRSYTIRFKAVYPTEVKTIDVPVTINENLPEPIFTLNAPANWNGRDTINVTPTITNLAAMQAKGVGTLTYAWKATGVAVTKSIAPGTLTLTRSQGSGVLTVALTMENGGPPVTSTATITVQEPATDSWVTRTPGANEKPVNKQFFARDSSGKGQLYYNGTLPASAATAVFLKIYTTDTGTDVLYNSYTSALGAPRTYAFTAPLAPGKVTYKAVFGSTTNGVDTVIATVSDLICGDAYIIEGQSNAVATADNPQETSTTKWIRTYEGGWGYAARSANQFSIGYWGKDLADMLLAKYNMPICIINGAFGGSRIDQHMPNPIDRRIPLFPDGWANSIYADLLNRVEAAKLTHGMRAVIWHQGEQDQGSEGPDGDFDYKFYQQYFVDLSAAWKQDFPNLSHYYIFQIWPAACGDTTTNDQLREVQRTLPRLFSKMRIMSTLGIVPGSGCHYVAAGYKQFAVLMSPLIEQDFYGLVPGSVITAPDLQRAYYTTAAKNEIALEFGQDMAAWFNASKDLFYLDGVGGKVTSGSVSGKVIKLQLNAASNATTIDYLKGTAWGEIQSIILKGTNGIAALTFHGVSIKPPGPVEPSKLKASAVSTSQINLAWTDNSNNETGFKVERATAAGGPFTLLATTAANATTYSSNGLTAGTQYFYRVSATNAVGTSETITADATTPPADQRTLSLSNMPFATPNPTNAGSVVQFSVAASGNDPLTYQWNFGDGSNAAGATVFHSYAAPGNYAVTVIVSDASGQSATGSMQMTVVSGANPGDDSDGDGVPNGQDDDDDNDGVSDLNEVADGTDPLNPTSATKFPFELLKMSGSAKFNATGKDSCSISGMLPALSAGFNPLGVIVKIDVGGATLSFTLDPKGRARTTDGFFGLKLKLVMNKTTKKKEFLGGTVPFKVKISKGSWTDEWADEGVDPASSAVKKPMAIIVEISAAGRVYTHTANVIYSSKAKVGGKFKK